MPEIDLKGQKFGRLTVVRRAEKPRYWVCECDCGNVKDIRSNHLTCVKIESCGDCNIFELPGKKIGKLTVLQYIPSEGGSGVARIFLCQCDCGNQTKVASSRLTHGRALSCGNCIDKTSIVGKTFGYLKVLEWAYIDNHSNSYWKCLCKCGNIRFYTRSTLSRNKPSCGCRVFLEGKERGEKCVAHILKQHQVENIRLMWAVELTNRKATGRKKCRHTMQSIAKHFGVSLSCINSIIYQKSWFYLPTVIDLLQKNECN